MPESIVSMFRCARRLAVNMIAHDVAAANRLHELAAVAARNEREQRQRVPALNNGNTGGIETPEELSRRPRQGAYMYCTSANTRRLPNRSALLSSLVIDAETEWEGGTAWAMLLVLFFGSSASRSLAGWACFDMMLQQINIHHMARSLTFLSSKCI